MAEKALRRLYKFVDHLDPSVLSYLYGEHLITKPERERIDAVSERTKKAGLILDSLANRDAKKAMEGLIEALEQDEEANEVFLGKIAEGKHLRLYMTNRFLLILLLLCIMYTPQ